MENRADYVTTVHKPSPGVSGAIDASGGADSAEDAVLKIHSIVSLAIRGAITVEDATALLLQDHAEHARRVLGKSERTKRRNEKI